MFIELAPAASIGNGQLQNQLLAVSGTDLLQKYVRTPSAKAKAEFTNVFTLAIFKGSRNF